MPEAGKSMDRTFTVLQKIDDVTYRIRKDRSKSFICHVDTQKKYEGDVASWMRTCQSF